MPDIVPVYPPASPVRRMPKSVRMSEVVPSPWGCMQCKKAARTYADGCVFCEGCQRKLGDNDKVNISRGRQRNTPPLEWRPYKA